MFWLSLAIAPSWAQEDETPGAVITVVSAAERGVESVPGTATVVTTEEIERLAPLSTSEVLQLVPGVSVQEEDPMGLRQNIGVRGLNPSRSRKVLVLEDGVPISLAPYGEPEMYYTPMVERMERVEVVKGSGSILFGPSTIGGVVNYITPAAPRSPTPEAALRLGADGYLQALAGYGDTSGPIGYQFTAIHERFAGPRDLNLVRTDLSTRLDLATGESSAVAVKLQIYDETSQATYLGLTTPQWLSDPDMSLGVHDRFDIRRYALSATHGASLGPRLNLVTRFYAHEVDRRWRRQDFDRYDAGYDYERIIDGAGVDILKTEERPEDGSAIYFRDSAAVRDRHFTIVGLEPRATASLSSGPVEHDLTLGVRGHAEWTEEKRWEGAFPEANTGEVVSHAQRRGLAFAAYAQERASWGRFMLAPGLRFEAFRAENTVLRDEIDGALVDLNPPEHTLNLYTALLPGAGFTADVAGPLSLYGGVHRGWAPPRTKDGIGPDGDTLSLEAERSWNSELGARLIQSDWFYAEVAGFRLDFQNQIIEPSEATATLSGGVVNGGATLHRGVEASLRLDPLAAAGWTTHLPLSLSYTFVDAHFLEGWGAAVEGQPLPYAPRHQATATVALEHASGLSAQVKGRYVGVQYTDEVATVDVSVNGLVGQIDPSLLFDARLAYQHEASGVGVYLGCKNLLNTPTISSRAPSGIQPGLPRFVFGGLSWER